MGGGGRWAFTTTSPSFLAAPSRVAEPKHAGCGQQNNLFPSEGGLKAAERVLMPEALAAAKPAGLNSLLIQRKEDTGAPTRWTLSSTLLFTHFWRRTLGASLLWAPLKM